MDDDLKNLSKEDEEELKEAVIEKRAVKRTGMRASHKAASLDVHNSIRRIYDEVSFYNHSTHNLPV